MNPSTGSIFKDSYLLEFLELPAGHAESDLHQALLEKLKDFLIELGRDFCFRRIAVSSAGWWGAHLRLPCPINLLLAIFSESAAAGSGFV
jgi:hypothetical protein